MEQENSNKSGDRGGRDQGRDIPVTDLNDGATAGGTVEDGSVSEQHAETAPSADDGDNTGDEPGNQDDSPPIDAGDDSDDDADPLNQALADAAASKEALLRAHAEMENLRKRSEREIAQARKFALERVMQDLLQVVDSLERGLQVDVEEESKGVEKLREGKQLTLKLLLKVLTDHGLEVVDPAGEKFDPERHEAVGTEAASGDTPTNTVVKVWQKGYVLNERLLRPAMVVVAR